MKKKIAILALVALFVSATSLSAQTATVKKTKEAVKTEVKCDKKSATDACCKDKKTAEMKKDAKSTECCKGKSTAECCKNKAVDGKAKCAEKADAKACDKKCDNKKAATVKKS